jgi:CrcB protein
VTLALLVASSGAIGAGCRYLADAAVQRLHRGDFPLGTLAVNVVGSVLAGLVTGLVWYHGASPRVRDLVVVGFCGGLTTWSTATWESVRLAGGARWAPALVFTLGGLVLALVGAAVGIALATL